MASKYSVHMHGAGWAHGHKAVGSLAEAKRVFREFCESTGTYADSGEAFATVSPWSQLDNTSCSYNYPIMSLELTPRGIHVNRNN